MFTLTLWCLKWLRTANNCENKNLIFSPRPGLRREGLKILIILSNLLETRHPSNLSHLVKRN